MYRKRLFPFYTEPGLSVRLLLEATGTHFTLEVLEVRGVILVGRPFGFSGEDPCFEMISSDSSLSVLSLSLSLV